MVFTEAGHSDHCTIIVRRGPVIQAALTWRADSDRCVTTMIDRVQFSCIGVSRHGTHRRANTPVVRQNCGAEYHELRTFSSCRPTAWWDMRRAARPTLSTLLLRHWTGSNSAETALHRNRDNWRGRRERS